MSIRTALHKIPEIGLDLPQTVAFIVSKLEEMDVKYPQTALMEGTLRTFNPEVRTFLMQRIGEVAEGIAKTFRAKEANKRWRCFGVFTFICIVPTSRYLSIIFSSSLILWSNAFPSHIVLLVLVLGLGLFCDTVEFVFASLLFLFFLFLFVHNTSPREQYSLVILFLTRQILVIKYPSICGDCHHAPRNEFAARL